MVSEVLTFVFEGKPPYLIVRPYASYLSIYMSIYLSIYPREYVVASCLSSGLKLARSQMLRAIRCCLLLATHVSALRLSPLVLRRQALSLAALAPALAPALPACAAAPPIGRSEGGVLWELELPPSFSITRRLASIVRSRVETMLAAEDAASGVQARLLLVPLGQQAARPQQI